MDWQSPYLLLLIVPALVLLVFFDAKTTHPMDLRRRRALLVVRAALVFVALAALASPARIERSERQAVVFVMDHSLSLGEEGLQRVYRVTAEVREQLPEGTTISYVAAGARPVVLEEEEFAGADAEGEEGLVTARAVMREHGAQTNLSSAVALAQGLFPAGASRHVVIVSDGQETRGDLLATARDAAVSGLRIHGVGVQGDVRPVVRVVRLGASKSRLSEGARLELTAYVESSLAGAGRIRLFENGLEVASEALELELGEDREVVFLRTPGKRNIYNYRAVVEGFEDDSIAENNEALSIVDVRGKPLLLYVEGEPGESRYLLEAMAREGIRLEVRDPEGIPRSLQDLAGFDGVILSDISAHRVGEAAMAMMRDYVDKLGGGLIMIGGMNSFGVGGYYRTPIEEVLPVKLKSPDQEQQQSSALALVMDRSGSMSGEKIEICKSAAIATSEILTRKDYIGVYAFDSNAHVVVPMARVTSSSSIANQIAALSSGGGTNIYPGMALARSELGKVRAKIKHMIVLTDGQTSGQGYQALASQCRGEGITISTVAVGAGAQVGLLQAIAAAGGGQAYVTMDPSAITRIFTQDTMVHTGRMIREEAFTPQLVENSPMLPGWVDGEAPPLLGYVKTIARATAQVPLVSDVGDPLLAHWRYGLGKVTAFTSDCKSRWAALWISQWEGYSSLWAQILRETARAPQGQNMDLRISERGGQVECVVDLLEDAGTRRNDARVEVDVYFVPANALGSRMRLQSTRALNEEGPGMYRGVFQPQMPGVYLVRARAGARMISAGYVHNPSAETATGRVDAALLALASELTGGGFLEGDARDLQLGGREVARYVELWPALLLVFLLLFFVDLAVRRWDHVRGLVEMIRG
ncbi:MAG: VWA domain-containing protein [Verrucomicrobiales bacterium]